MQTTTPIHPGSPADRRILVNGLTLIALGLSILFLNSWDSLIVRTAIGSFWGIFLLVVNGPHALRVWRKLRRRTETDRREFGIAKVRDFVS